MRCSGTPCFIHPMQQSGMLRLLKMKQTADCIPVTLQLGATGYFCMELFCGSGNLTLAMKHFFPDSFGVDHKVGKQRVKVICLDLTREDHQELGYAVCHVRAIMSMPRGQCKTGSLILPEKRSTHQHLPKLWQWSSWSQLPKSMSSRTSQPS